MNNIEDRDKMIKGIIIAKDNGIPLVQVLNDESINSTLIPAFVSALHIFGKENLGRIEEIMIKGLDVDMYIATKHNLIIIAIMSSDIKKVDLHKEAEEALDTFYEIFKDELNNEGSYQDVFAPYEILLREQIKNYVSKISTTEKGFFKKLFSSFKSNKKIG
ncbi:MAG: hypothetical protein ACTSYZ_14815 [Candidatus Helarchaeota archaeon]